MAYMNLLIRERADLLPIRRTSTRRKLTAADGWVTKGSGDQEDQDRTHARWRRRYHDRARAVISRVTSSSARCRLGRDRREVLSPSCGHVDGFPRIIVDGRPVGPPIALSCHPNCPRRCRCLRRRWGSARPSRRCFAPWKKLKRFRRRYPPRPRRAFQFAYQQHGSQVRDSGAVHVPSVAGRPPIGRHEHGHGLLQTGLLHDVVEDTSVTVEEIRKKFGDEVARCVDGVTKLSKLQLLLGRRAPGRERAQDAAGHGRGYPRGSS